MEKCFCYLRVSGKSQAASDRDGLVRQEQVIKDYCKRFNLEIVAQFQDVISGRKDGFDRPGLTDMFAALKANGVKLILVENETRIARNVLVGELIFAEFRKLKCRVVSCESGQELTAEDDDTDGTKVFHRHIQLALGALDRFRIVTKLRAARLRVRQAKGRCEGVKPYGATEAERQVIQTIVALRNEGKTHVEIVAWLNANVPTRKGKKWHQPLVSKILSRQKVAV